MWALILGIAGGLFGVQAGGGEETWGGIFFALVGIFGGGYLGYKMDKGFEVDAKEKHERRMRERKEQKDREFKERYNIQEDE